jgi:hypothetical protein
VKPKEFGVKGPEAFENDMFPDLQTRATELDR